MPRKKEAPAQVATGAPKADLAIGLDSKKSAQFAQGLSDRLDFICREAWLGDELSPAQKRDFFMGMVGTGLKLVGTLDQQSVAAKDEPREDLEFGTGILGHLLKDGRAE